MINLKFLILDGINFNTVDYNTVQWENFADIFLYGRDINLSSLEIRDINISREM